jgi:hypothetical protein
MKLTIIPSDKSVGVDGKFYLNLDLNLCNVPNDIHALQWKDTSGWIEFEDLRPNEDINELPAWVSCCLEKWTEANTPKPPNPPTVEENKLIAVAKLQQTDWTTVSDVGDSTKSSPYLSNVNDFIVYRNAIRQYAINPVSGYIDWPQLPEEVWTL